MFLLLPTLVLLLTAIFAAGAVLAMVTRDPALAGSTTGPFATPAPDTVRNMTALSETPAPMPAATPWRVRSLASLRDVEAFLDALESHGVAEREVLSLGVKSFAVRWR